MLFFAFDPNGAGFTIHKTADQAKEEAAIALEMEREFSQEGWDENVTRICWGRIHQIASANQEHAKAAGFPDVDYNLQNCDESSEETL